MIAARRVCIRRRNASFARGLHVLCGFASLGRFRVDALLNDGQHSLPSFVWRRAIIDKITRGTQNAQRAAHYWLIGHTILFCGQKLNISIYSNYIYKKKYIYEVMLE